ncbi:MarR family winged helix-turn-helix transcriptional regulator [Streptomyces lavendofoliae]|uniref:HTH marR-type domain-containing protein n=1 Tax=Streptomyces lavendofoliae TaxID=67314 RepID=A0A918I209_9ACTN|nr:MarR family transcriptional regulator [Streptomyces lavendofoliae]GGU49919.1 hypothetical protein GCM10010274_43190 [Streptomyces lavendofoliae]
MPERLAGLPSAALAGTHSASTSAEAGDAAALVAREVVDLLEVVWSRTRDRVATAPVSSSQLKALYVLHRCEGTNLRALAAVLGAAPSSASRMCDRLEALGFIERTPSSTSRREVELRLTGRGATYLADLRSRRETALSEVVSTMPPAARAALVQGLAAFRHAADGLAFGAGGTAEAMETA